MNFSLSLKFPDTLTKDVDVRQTFRDGPGHAARRGLEAIMQSIVAQTESRSIADAYRIEQESGTGTLVLRLANDNPIQPYRENDTRPHWAPFTTDKELRQGAQPTALTKWAKEHNIPVFLVARKIAQEGTRGNYTVRNTWARAKDELWAAVVASTGRWFASYGAAS